MHFISYGGNAYLVTAGVKRLIPTPTILNELRAAAGHPPIQPVTRGTLDYLPDYIGDADVRQRVLDVGAQVENLRRIVVDTHPNPYTATQGA